MIKFPLTTESAMKKIEDNNTLVGGTHARGLNSMRARGPAAAPGSTCATHRCSAAAAGPLRTVWQHGAGKRLGQRPAARLEQLGALWGGAFGGCSWQPTQAAMQQPPVGAPGGAKAACCLENGRARGWRRAQSPGTSGKQNLVLVAPAVQHG